ncbi:MAG: type II toxin-antitoxin system prevent-host-death family antitoxin [Nitrospirae bacterium]|nr:type II toxin-antitoxin system prevent-host-death family antitoxin [Nitrospirota bacterium]
MHTRVGVREAKTNLGRLLSDVRRGATVTITDHGRDVARLVPVEEKPAKRSLDERLRDMVEAGLLEASDGKETFASMPLPIDTGLGDIAQRMLREDRDAR